MIISGIDYSYTSPAITVYDNSKELTFDNVKCYNLNTVKKTVGEYNNITINQLPKKFEHDFEKFSFVFNWAKNIITDNNVDVVFIEGYSLGSNSGLVFQIAENTSILKKFLFDVNIRYETIPPTTVKKYYSGYGNAKKERMILTFNNETGLDLSETLGRNNKFAKPIDDIVDSYAILKCGVNNYDLS